MDGLDINLLMYFIFTTLIIFMGIKGLEKDEENRKELIKELIKKLEDTQEMKEKEEIPDDKI
jgi:large-conductance mechanosensitive channel